MDRSKAMWMLTPPGQLTPPDSIRIAATIRYDNCYVTATSDSFDVNVDNNKKSLSDKSWVPVLEKLVNDLQKAGKLPLNSNGMATIVSAQVLDDKSNSYPVLPVGNVTVTLQPKSYTLESSDDFGFSYTLDANTARVAASKIKGKITLRTPDKKVRFPDKFIDRQVMRVLPGRVNGVPA
jgi:hypothetical protein